MDKLKVSEPTPPYSLLCSGCRNPCAGDDAHVVPGWNPVCEDFLTTYRCSNCWLQALNETRAKIRVLDDELRTKFCNFLERHGFTDVDIVRQAPLAEASTMIGAFLNAIASEKLKLAP
jgi:hypothetical protein